MKPLLESQNLEMEKVSCLLSEAQVRGEVLKVLVVEPCSGETSSLRSTRSRVLRGVIEIC